jgi:hypothetical protein
MHDDQTTRDMLELLRGRFFGKYRGLVATPLPDPTLRGRVQVTVPAVLGEQIVWAMPCVPFAGKNVGMHMLPPVGAGVWVEFEAGDPSYPIWAGCYWAQGDIAPSTRWPNVKFIRTDLSRCASTISSARSSFRPASRRSPINALSIKLDAVEVKASAVTRNISVDPARVSVNDGTQDVT